MLRNVCIHAACLPNCVGKHFPEKGIERQQRFGLLFIRTSRSHFVQFTGACCVQVFACLLKHIYPSRNNFGV